MESSRFDRWARAVGAPHSRRSVATVLGVVLAGPLADHHLAAAKKKKPKAALCLNGQTVMASSKTKKKLLKQGATPGACVPGGPQGCQAGDCDPCLREVCVEGACACPRNMARDNKGVCSIIRSCRGIGQNAANPAECCSSRGNAIGIGQFSCVPGNETCAADSDCLNGQHCVGNLCAPAYIATVGDQCSDRAFDICSNRDQCKTGLCEDNLCKTCTSKAQCGDDRPNDGVTCICQEGLCLTSDYRAILPVESCSQCPRSTAYCITFGNLHSCIPLCGKTLN